MQTDIATPTTLAWTLKFEQQIAPQTSLTLAYIGSHSYHQILSLDANEPAFVVCPSTACPASIAPGTVYYPTTVKANPDVANTTSWVSAGNASYNALEVDVRRSFANGVQFRGNYTWSKNLDNGSAWNTSVSANTPAFVSVPQLPALDWGPAATDVRHIASLNGSWDLPFGPKRRFASHLGSAASTAVSGWTLSAISNLQSGFPFTPQLGYNPTGSGDTRNPVRPDVNPNFHGSLYAGGSTAARANQFFNPAAFLAPAAGAVGNLRRDTLSGPGFANLDLSLAKSTHDSRAGARAIPRGVLQRPQPHQSDDAQPGRLQLRSPAKHNRICSHRASSPQSDRRSRHRRSHQPTTAIWIEVAVLARKKKQGSMMDLSCRPATAWGHAGID